MPDINCRCSTFWERIAVILSGHSAARIREMNVEVFFNLPLYILHRFSSPWPLPSHTHAPGSSSGLTVLPVVRWMQRYFRPSLFLLLLSPSCQSYLSWPVQADIRPSSHPLQSVSLICDQWYWLELVQQIDIHDAKYPFNTSNAC